MAPGAMKTMGASLRWLRRQKDGPRLAEAVVLEEIAVAMPTLRCRPMWFLRPS